MFHSMCKNGHKYLWSSSPELVSSAGYTIHSNNLIFACGILCSGNAFAKVKRMMDFIGVKCISLPVLGLLMATCVVNIGYLKCKVSKPLYATHNNEEFWNEHLLEVQAKLSGKSLRVISQRKKKLAHSDLHQTLHT